MLTVAPGSFDRSLNRPMRKTTLLQKTHALGARHAVGRRFIEFAPQNFARPLVFTLGQADFGFPQRFAGDAVAFQFGKDAVVAVTANATIHQGFGETLLRKEFGFLQPIQQSFDIVVILRVRG